MIQSVNRRTALMSGLVSSLGMSLVRAAAQERGTFGDVLRYQKSIRVDEAMWLYALSEDGRRVAYAGYKSNKVFIVDLESGKTTQVDGPDLNAKAAMTWSPDNEHFAVSNVDVCLIISATQAKCVKQFKRPDFARFGKAALFSRDGSKIYFQSPAFDETTLVLEHNIVDN